MPDPYHHSLQTWLDEAGRPGASMMDETHLSTDSSGRLTIEETIAAPLPSLSSPDGEEFVLKQTIGTGGTARVRAARQRALRRTVAVKELSPHKDVPARRDMLLREAIVTGRLEHPNVAPVHDVRADDSGRPVIIMKLIEGVRWAEILDNPERHEGLFDARDPLRFHLGVLEEVCRALEFAHSQGVLHRDIKPDNVMIGRFGEVYLLDWGLAVALEDRPDRIVRLAREVRGVEGTPGYMAPEMARGDGAELGTWTDVYLLGACLHHVLTGRPRHRGRGVVGMLASAYASETFAFEDVPPELAEVCNRACAREPGDRFQTAGELRCAIDDFLEHRASLDLTREAEQSLAHALALLEAGEPTEDAGIDECRYALTHALRLWPGNESARAALQSLVEARIRSALAAGDAGAAEALLGSLPEADEDLSRQVRHLRAADRADKKALEDIRSASDVHTNARAMRRFWSLTGVSSLAVFSAVEWGARADVAPSAHAGVMLGFAIVAASTLPLQRKIAPKTGDSLAHLRIRQAGAVRIFGAMLFFAIGWAWSVSVAPLVALTCLLMSLQLICTQIFAGPDFEMFPSAGAFAAAGAAALAMPSWAILWFGVGSAGSAFGLAWWNHRLQIAPE